MELCYRQQIFYLFISAAKVHMYGQAKKKVCPQKNIG